jgi:hypothetical protein
MNAVANMMRRMAVVGVLLVGLSMACGCDMYGTTGYGYTTWYPDTTYYDPTWEIQSVIDYRQDVMDWSAAGWSDYILQ